MKKSAVIAIVGRPNVGKSTLINRILNQKIAIVSYKPQTTRNQIKGVYQDKNHHFVFIDTPGFHQPKNKLDVFLNSEVKSSFKACDIVLFLSDLTRDVNEEDIQLLNFIKSYDIKNLIVLFTKKDLAKKVNVELKMQQLNLPLDQQYLAINNNSISLTTELFEVIDKMVSKDIMITEQIFSNDDFIISEIIREQILLLYRQEVPHSTAVVIDAKRFDEETRCFHIESSILIEKNSQKPILIGKNGAAIKQLGINSRKELLKIFDCKINLKLFVKVEKDWRNNEYLLKSIGYFK